MAALPSDASDIILDLSAIVFPGGYTVDNKIGYNLGIPMKCLLFAKAYPFHEKGLPVFKVPFPLFIHFCLARLGELCIMPLALSSFFALPAFFHPAEGKSGVEETVTDA